MQLFLIRQRVGVALAITFLLAAPALALADPPLSQTSPTFPTSQTGGSATATNCPNNPGQASICNPLQVSSICGLLKQILQGLVAVGIPVAVLFVIWSGFQFVLAQGSDKKLRKAKSNFYYTIVGIGLFLGAWVFTMIIAATINAIGGANILTCS